MELECTCSEITLEEWKRKMKGSRPVNYKWLSGKIKKHLPKLYEALCLDYYNPWENECRVNKQYYILVHSATEYFILKTNRNGNKNNSYQENYRHCGLCTCR